MSLNSISPVMANAFPNGDSASPAYSSQHQRSLHDQLESFRRSDSARDSLLQQLLNENLKLKDQIRDIQDDHYNEKMSRRKWQTESEQYRIELEQVRSASSSDAFALALIDGDGCIFQDALLRAAGEGGADAAHLLNAEIKQVLQDRCGAAAGRVTFMVHIYANFDDLSRKLSAVGLLGTAGDFHTFARSFSFNQPLFNFIDVGRGKERADHKIKEMFRLFVNNTHCKQIIFGGTHDNGYLLNLEPLRRDPSIASRITLLETTDAEWQYKNLGFPVVRFDSVFRNKPLPEGRGSYTSPAHAYQASGQHGVNTPVGTAARSAPPATLPLQPSQYTSTTPNPTSVTPLPTPPAVAGDPKPASIPLKSPSPGPKTSSYAAVGGQSEAKKINIAPAKEARARRYALFNSDNDRIDIKLPKPSGESEMRYSMRVKQTGKCCNNHHLRGFCKTGANCSYSHEPLLPKELRLVLAHKARTSVCPRGSRCTDALCYLGHQCPHDDCHRPDCFFGDLHGIDSAPALKVYDDDEVEVLNQS